MDNSNDYRPPQETEPKPPAEQQPTQSFLSYGPEPPTPKTSFVPKARRYLQTRQHPMVVVGSGLLALVLVVGVVAAIAGKFHDGGQQASQAIPGSTGDTSNIPYTPGTASNTGNRSAATKTDGDSGARAGGSYIDDSDFVNDGINDIVDSGGTPEYIPDSPDTDDSDEEDVAYDPTFDDYSDETNFPYIPFLSNPSSSTNSSTTKSTSSSTGGNTKATKVTKLLIFVEENRSLEQMKRGMPYAFSLAKKYGYATNYYGIRHPSLPNYIAIAGGDTYGISNDGPPSENGVGGASIFGKALKAGKKVAVYADGMPANCALKNGGGNYRVKHNPWAYFKNERAQCKKHDVASKNLVLAARLGTLPNLGMVIPNMCHDAHDCSLKTADNWFKVHMVNIFSGPDWKAGRLAIVLTADEDDHNANNNVLTVVIHPSQDGNVVTRKLDHYSLSKLASQVTHSGPIKNAQSAPSMSDAFGLPL